MAISRNRDSNRDFCPIHDEAWSTLNLRAALRRAGRVGAGGSLRTTGLANPPTPAISLNP